MSKVTRHLEVGVLLNITGDISSSGTAIWRQQAKNFSWGMECAIHSFRQVKQVGMGLEEVFSGGTERYMRRG